MFVPQWDGQLCSLGYDVIDWIEAYCCHGPGDVQGKPVTLDNEMASFVVRAYELDRKTGRRKIDRAMLSRVKGRAKSEVAGFIATAEAFGPVRFDGWDGAGQPAGKPVVSPLIKCLATEESQAGNTFENAAFIVCDFGRDAHPDVFGGASGVRQYQSATAIYLPHGGEMRATTSGAASKDGGKETFVVPDETHLYVTNELRSMYATVARNCGKRKEAEPWMLQTTTAYKAGQKSVAEAVLTAWKAGRLPNASHWLVDHREAIGDVDLDNRLHTMNQLRYVYGDAATWMDLDRIYRTMLDPTECETPEVAARYFLNLPSPSDAATSANAVDPATWSSLAAPQPDGSPSVFALDVAPDHTSATIAAAWQTPAGSRLQLAETLPGVDWVAARWLELHRTYGARLVVEQTGTAAFLLPHLQNADTVSRRFFADACSTLDAAVTARTLTHGNRPELNAAVSAARWSSSGEAGQRVLSRKDPRVSPLVAAALALHGLANGKQKSKRLMF